MPKSTRILALALALTVLALPLAAQKQPFTPTPVSAYDRSEHLERAQRIVEDREEHSGRTFDATWRANEIERLAGFDIETLDRVIETGNHLELSTKVFGDSQADLVFTPLATSCRAYDSRTSGNVPGPIVQNQEFTIFIAGNLAGQGGSNNCGVPFGPTTAIVANVLAVNTGGKGNFQIWPFEGVNGDASINFAAQADLDINLINGVMLPICNPATSGTNCGGGDLNVRLNFAANSHFVVNITGYFTAPEPTPLQCQNVSAYQEIPAFGVANYDSGTCPSGYTMTGGGHNYTFNDDDIEIWQSSPNNDGTAWTCRVYNDNADAEDFFCFARCCRVPGQ